MSRASSKLFLTDSEKDHLFVQKIFAEEKKSQSIRPLKKDLHIRKLAHQSHASACTKNYAAYLRLKSSSLEEALEADTQEDFVQLLPRTDFPFEAAVRLAYSRTPSR